MTPTTTQKTPGAQLAGESTEGLNPTHIKELNMSDSTLSTRLELDGFTTDVEPANEGVNITFTDAGRWTYGINITRTDARRLASALLDASAPDFGTAPIEELEEHAAVARKMPVEIPVSDLAAGTITDVFRFAQDNDMPTGDVMEAVEAYIDGMAEAESLSPAQWCKRWRQQHTSN